MTQRTTELVIDRSSPLPLYWQLKDQIRTRIESGELTEGALLPSEAELRRALGISRPTIRQALSELAIEGVISKEQGRGSFVAKRKIEGRFLSKLQTFGEEMLQQGLAPSTRVLELAKVAAIPRVNDRLGLPLSAPLVALARLRSADAVPVVYVETYLPFDQFGGLLNADLERASLYQTLEGDYGARVSRVTRQIEAVAARKSEADLLQVALGSPICLSRTVAYTDSPGPVEYSIARYRGDMTRFSIELYR
jgi:GntR family transcriptional regulator